MALEHAKPGEIVDLGPLGAGLKDEISTAIIKSDEFEAIRLVVRAGEEIPEHKVPGSITLHCLEGCVRLGLEPEPPQPVFLKKGQWIYLEGGMPHSVTGEEDSALLLTIFLPHGR